MVGDAFLKIADDVIRNNLINLINGHFFLSQSKSLKLVLIKQKLTEVVYLIRSCIRKFVLNAFKSSIILL